MRNRNKTTVQWIIYAAAFFSAYYLLAVLLTHGGAFYNIYLKSPILDELRYSDFFMSFTSVFERNFYAIGNIIYPPVGLLFYPLLAMLMPDRLMDGNWHTLAESPEGMLAYQVTNVIFIVLFVWICARAIQFKGYKKCLLIFALLVSFPMIYNYERGNNLIYTLLFMMLFVFWKDSDKRWQRELSLVFLALAAAMKLSPALLGLTLLTEKRYKDAIKAVVYGVIAYALPFFLFFEGFTSIADNFKAAFGFSSGLALNYLYSAFVPTWNNFLIAVCSVFGESIPAFSHLGQNLSLVATVSALICVFLLRDNWKRVALILCIIITYPAVSYSYCLMYLIIPFVLFLNGFSHGETIKRRDIWYGILFLLMLVPLPFPSGRFFFFGQPYQQTTYNALVSLFGIIAMQTSLIVEGFASISKRNVKIAASTAALAAFAVFAVNQIVFAAREKAYYNTPSRYYTYAAKDNVYDSIVSLLPDGAVVRQEVELDGNNIYFVDLLVRYTGVEADGSAITVKILDADTNAVLREATALSWQFTDLGFVRFELYNLTLPGNRAVLEISADIPAPNRPNTLLFLAMNDPPASYAGEYATVNGQETDQIVALRVYKGA